MHVPSFQRSSLRALTSLTHTSAMQDMTLAMLRNYCCNKSASPIQEPTSSLSTTPSLGLIVGDFMQAHMCACTDAEA